MSYRPSRDETEDVIQQLADRYPKTFFLVPQQRKPLKKNIVTDLQRDGAPFAHELLSSAVDWYQSHFGYLYALQAGARRVDLDGKEVGTVTEQEAGRAQLQVKEDKRKASEKTQALAAIQSLHRQGRIPDDVLKQLDAPPRPRDVPMKPKPQPVPDRLARVREALRAADTLMIEGCDALRVAMAAAALGVVIKETKQVIDSLEPGSE